MKKDNTIDSDQLPDISSNDEFSHPEHAVRIKEIRTKLDLTLNRLPKGQRMVFILRHYQQLPVKEIAEDLVQKGLENYRVFINGSLMGLKGLEGQRAGHLLGRTEQIRQNSGCTGRYLRQDRQQEGERANYPCLFPEQK